ncbi:hypothetical protein [Variovorax sp. JS1663]|uniref:hypothetical protein n=1 Tax=Variovorax sp. JS1663 TaxID=1851577 RepID=UPI0013021DFC|nr:hypothetical protein [Variovorax sp. JS1663]
MQEISMGRVLISWTATMALATMVQSTAVQAQSRGALLYETHCIACHTDQVHWRQRRLATDWPSLKAQVWRWQSDAALGWGDDDVVDVARYLNEEFYRFPDPASPRAGLRADMWPPIFAERAAVPAICWRPGRVSAAESATAR